jgi:peptidoglycan hydrolase FlgJ
MSTFPSSPTAISANPMTQRPEREQLASASKQFEAIFVRQMLAAARKAAFGEPLLGGQAMDTFRQMQDERFADLAAERGAFGLAKMIEAQLAGRIDATSIPPRNGEVAAPQGLTEGSTSGQAQKVQLGSGTPPPSFGWSPSPYRGGA